MNEEISEKIEAFFDKKELSIEDRYFITKKLNEEYWLEIQGDEDLDEEDLEIGTEEEEGEEIDDEESEDETDEEQEETPEEETEPIPLVNKPKLKVDEDVSE